MGQLGAAAGRARSISRRQAELGPVGEGGQAGLGSGVGRGRACWPGACPPTPKGSGGVLGATSRLQEALAMSAF